MKQPKNKPCRSKKWCDMARDQSCKVELPGICNGRTDTTVLAHNPHAKSGMGMKPPDYDAADCCSDCHDVIDGRVKHYFTKQEIQDYFETGRVKTAINRAERGFKATWGSIELKGEI